MRGRHEVGTRHEGEDEGSLGGFAAGARALGVIGDRVDVTALVCIVMRSRDDRVHDHGTSFPFPKTSITITKKIDHDHGADHGHEHAATIEEIADNLQRVQLAPHGARLQLAPHGARLQRVARVRAAKPPKDPSFFVFVAY